MVGLIGIVSDLEYGALVTGDFIGTVEVGLCIGLVIFEDCSGLSFDMRLFE